MKKKAAVILFILCVSFAFGAGFKGEMIAKDRKVTIDDEPETVRRIVLGYYKSVLLNSGMAHAAKVLNAFQYDFFQSGEAGLVLACYNVLNT